MAGGAGSARSQPWAGAFWRRLAYGGARYGPEWWLRWSPTFIGWGFAASLPSQRDVVRHNLRSVLGERAALVETVDVARTFAAYAHCFAESLAAGRPRARHTKRRIRGLSHLEPALASGRGTVIVTAHTGPWDSSAALLARDYDVDVLVAMAREPHEDARRWHDSLRERTGVRITHVGDDPLDALGLLAHLRRGGVVAMQIDRMPRKARGVSIRWSGGVVTLPEGPFVLAATVGAPLLPVFARRVGFFDYELTVAPAVELERKAGRSAVEDAARRVGKELERFVRAHPTQWFHFEPPAD